MHRTILIGMFAAIVAGHAGAAQPDDRAVITQQMQDLSDALVPGAAAVWDKYLDANVVYAEEDGSYKGKADVLKEIRPLPKGLGGNIRIVLLSFHQDGDVAVGLFRQVETENYFAQVLHANYLTNTTWRKRADGWKMIAGQVLAEKTDPPAIALPADRLTQYAGTYRLKGADRTYALTLANGKLIATRTGRKPESWNAEATDVFFVSGDPRIRKIFQRDSSGRITGFVERRESWDIVWEKVG